MHGAINIWELLSGVAIFLLGMKFLEEALHQLTGRAFKLFLKKQTATKPRAILSGVLITGVLQSSSIVNLMLLAFVGSNVIPMQHALAVILGSNLGSTVTSWIILSIGFNASIENITFPLIGLGGIIMLLSNKDSKWYQWSKFCLGLGFLFLGLNYIKTGMEATVSMIDFTALQHFPAIIFLLIGLLITTLIQSSSATVVIVLSAIHLNVLSLYEATAIVLGSEIGTTVKFLLASIKGPSAKKRVAVGNFMYNVINAAIILIFLGPVNILIKDIIGIKDNMYALVFFQTLANIIGILFFYPFLGIYGKFLEKLFKTADDDTFFIGKVNVEDTDPAITALENELSHCITDAIVFSRQAFAIPAKKLLEQQNKKSIHSNNMIRYYEYLKKLHGEIHGYAVQLQAVINGNEMLTTRLNQLISANRNNMYAAKTVKDMLADINQLKNSSNDIKFKFYNDATLNTENFFQNISGVLQNKTGATTFEKLSEIYKLASNGYLDTLKQLYDTKTHQQLSEIEISTLINFNMELYTAFKSFVFAVKDFMLNTKEATYFDELPGLIR